MRTMILAACLLLPVAATGQTAIDGYNQAKRERAQFEYEQEMRKIQLERMRNGEPEDPRISADLRDADARRAASACRTERYTFNGAPMTCKVCPGKPTACND